MKETDAESAPIVTLLGFMTNMATSVQRLSDGYSACNFDSASASTRYADVLPLKGAPTIMKPCLRDARVIAAV